MLEACLKNFAPRPRVRTLDYARANVQTADGRPYDHSAYSHLGAPGGPLDALDCPQYLTIWEQFASRLGKTFVAQVGTMKHGDIDPCPMMFVSADQKLAVEVTERTYRMMERCASLRCQLRPKNRRRQSCIDLSNCRQFVGWARSVSTLADKGAKYGHANEIDKWEHQSTSTEADPLELFADRFKEFPVHKKVMESTPALKTTSRIERGRLASFNASYFVPCPHCGEYQTLKMGDGKTPGGISWDKTEAGKSDKDLARKTARYVCAQCENDIKDEHRGPMMRAGVWVPEGCGVDKEQAKKAAKEWKEPGRPLWKGWRESPWITGTPARDGQDAGYQLSSLYALSLTWGDIAAKFVDSRKNPQNLRNFVNQWLGETWETIERKTTWQQLGARLIEQDLPRFVCPEWSSLITIGIDRQEDDRYPWVVCAWGPERTHAVIAYGESPSLPQIEAELFARTYNHVDGGDVLRPSFALVDSGFRPHGIYEFCAAACRKGLNILPCKGSPKALNSDYIQSRLGANSSMEGMVLFHVDTIRSQAWMDRVLHSLKPGDSGSAILHSASLETHQDFLEQVLNDAAVTELDTHNNARENWERVEVNLPNDFRDCWRYAYCAMLIATRNAPIPARRVKIEPKRSAVVSAGASRPDGRSWL